MPEIKLRSVVKYEDSIARPLYKIVDFTVITPHCFTSPLLFLKGFNFSLFSIERNGKLKLVFDLPLG